jgi:predicted kinase
MPKVSEEFANAAAVAGGFMTIHLFKLLIEKGVLDVDDGKAVLKKVRNDLAEAARGCHLDATLFEAEHIVSKMYASLQNGTSLPAGTAAPREENRSQH